jgi:hypothetical protein
VAVAVAESTNILPAEIQLSELVEAVAAEPEKLDFQMHHQIPEVAVEVERVVVAEVEASAAQAPQESSWLSLFRVQR